MSQNHIEVRVSGPAYVHYSSELARLRTFDDWPRSMLQKPEELAQAGFFYTGCSDRTKCFYCGGILNQWKQDDIPWEEHARILSGCAFVHIMKGTNFIESAGKGIDVCGPTKMLPPLVPIRPHFYLESWVDSPPKPMEYQPSNDGSLKLQ